MRLIVKAKVLSRWSSLLLFVLLVVAPLGMSTAAATSSGTSAEASNGITFSPTQKEVVISSGLLDALTNVTLTNNSGKDLIGKVRLLDFKTLNDTGGLIFSQAGVPLEKYGLANWMTLANGDTINVLNGHSVDIPVHISNRADLAPGGHYGAVVITLNTTSNTTSQRANFKQELVSLLLVKKLGGEHYGLQLQSFVVDSKRNIPTSATLRFKSTGNVHVIPRGFVQVTDPRGKLVAKGIIDPESTMILPDTSRQLVTLLQPIADSNLPGRYKITAYYRYDGQDQFSTETIYINRFVWSTPLTILTILTGVIVLLLLRKILYIKLKSRRKFK